MATSRLTGSSPGAQLRALISSHAPCYIMGAYDGVSARIAAEAGFPALWASGFCISTASGLRDSDEASWSEMLGIVSGMVEATDLPILVDGDTGHGSFNAARR